MKLRNYKLIPLMEVTHVRVIKLFLREKIKLKHVFNNITIINENC
jgi:hypothetical protein